MKQASFYFLIILFLFTGFVSGQEKVEEQGPNYLVILSLDGFRWDYPTMAPTPNLDAIAANGTKAVSMIPSFPSTTFANHYTLATGLYPDHHGIILNNFYAPDFKQYYNKRHERETVRDGKFYGGEPIWVTAEKQNMKTATFFWVGSEADIQNVRPTYWKLYKQCLPFEQRIDTTIYWLSLPEKDRPHLVMLYFHEPDESGHNYGPKSDSMKPVISHLDSLVGVLRNKLAALPIGNKINLIIVSDHGMAQLSPEKEIILDQKIDTSLIAIEDGWNPTMNLKAKDGMIDSLYQQIKKIEHIQVWKHGEAPENLHHGTNIRLHDMSLVADDGWSIYWSWENHRAKGTHGYDPKNMDVHAIFYAEGPDFKKQYVKSSFQNIHVYPLMTYLLQLNPAPMDGKLDSIIDVTTKHQ
jgi:predicted AlkP superfamily pyrophosphatase or phosphodiesterase